MGEGNICISVGRRDGIDFSITGGRRVYGSLQAFFAGFQSFKIDSNFGLSKKPLILEMIIDNLQCSCHFLPPLELGVRNEPNSPAKWTDLGGTK